MKRMLASAKIHCKSLFLAYFSGLIRPLHSNEIQNKKSFDGKTKASFCLR